jgi:hypothetical protein
VPPQRLPLLATLRVAAACTTLGAAALSAQGIPAHSLVRLSSPAEQQERLRIAIGQDSADGSLLRALGQRFARAHPARTAGANETARPEFIALLPELAYVYNSGHAWSWNDGANRGLKGGNVTLSAGFVLRQYGVTLQLVPQVIYEANLAIPVLPYADNRTPARKIWANPFHGPPESIDAPLRFGTEPRLVLRGQNRLAVDVPAALRLGLSTENRWWGPGVRNALVLGSQGPGFGHFFIESREPWVTRAGSFEAQYLLGLLRESKFFDYDASNDQRSLSAAAVTWRPPPGLDALVPEIGLSRAVMAEGAPRFDNALDFLRDVGRPFSEPSDVGARGRDQITALFARWLVPAAGLEAWLEWARYEQPINLRDLLVNPGHTQGYTLGASWAQPHRRGYLQSQMEFTYVEPSASIRVRPAVPSYTSASVPQGWTHEGELIGPAVGQAGSSQWLAFDWYRNAGEHARADQPRLLRVTQLGVQFGRWRRDNGEPFEDPFSSLKREDVSLWLTLRSGWRIGPLDALLEFTDGARLNYLFQAFDRPPSEGGWAGIDIRNRTLALTLSPNRS